MYKCAMHRVIRIVLLFVSALVSAGDAAPGQQPSASPALDGWFDGFEDFGYRLDELRFIRIAPLNDFENLLHLGP